MAENGESKYKGCRETTINGRPCNARPRPGTDLCPWHTPELKAKHHELSVKGGLGKSNKVRLAKNLPTADLTAEEVLLILGGIFLEIAAGNRDGAIGPQLASLARAMMDVRRVVAVETRLAEMFRRMGDIAEKVGA